MATQLPPVGTIVPRPVGISGCLQTFAETTLPNTIRNNSEDNQSISVRRRATHPTRTGEATVIVPQDEVELWRKWFEIDCYGGVLPTYIKMPYGKDEVWRFAGPLTYEWIMATPGKHAAKISFAIERLPHYTP